MSLDPFKLNTMLYSPDPAPAGDPPKEEGAAEKEEKPTDEKKKVEFTSEQQAEVDRIEGGAHPHRRQFRTQRVQFGLHFIGAGLLCVRQLLELALLLQRACVGVGGGLLSRFLRVRFCFGLGAFQAFLHDAVNFRLLLGSYPLS